MTFHPADALIVGAYFVIMVAVGIYYAGRMKTVKDFFGGGGRVPWWLSGVSFYMTTFSAFSFVVYSELAYKHGLVAMTVFWMSPLATLVVAKMFAASWRRAARTSALEFIEQRYSNGLRQALAWLSIPLRVVDNGIKLFVIATLVCGTFGIGQEYMPWLILFSGIVIFAYTFLGGLWGVVVTDFVQAIVMVLGVAIVIPLSFARIDGDGGFFGAAPAGFFDLVDDTFDPYYLFVWYLILLLNYSSAWSLVQRFYSVKSDGEARKVGYLVTVLQFLTPPLLVLPAMAARIYMPDLSPQEITGVYGIIIRDLLPIGMTGMVIAGMFAATMSMLSSEYNAIASVMTTDVYQRLFDPDAAPKRLLLVGRVATSLLGALCIGIAVLVLYRPEDKSLFDVMVKAFSIFLPPIAIPVLLGLKTRWASSKGALCGLVAGMATGVAMYALSFREGLEYLSRNTWIMPATSVATLLALALGTFAFRASAGERERTDRFFDNMAVDRVELAGSRDASDGESAGGAPLVVVGCSIGALGAFLAVLSLFLGMADGRWVSLAVGLVMALGGAACWVLGRSKPLPVPGIAGSASTRSEGGA